MISQRKLGTLLYLSNKHEIWVDPKQSKNFIFSQNKFWVNSQVGADPEWINNEYDSFCEEKLAKIIESGLTRLRIKKVEIELDFTDGKNSYKKEMMLSVDDYLDLIGYSRKIDFKIGAFKKEWSISQIAGEKKNFVLYFNLDLIKFDTVSRINYTIASELANLFHRNKGAEFNKTLEKLHPTKMMSVNFFSSKAGDILNKKPQLTKIIVLTVVIVLILYLSVVLYTLLTDFVADLLRIYTVLGS